MNQVDRTALMKRALSLAARGAGWTAPNPRVGALLVRDGQVIGRGFHRRFGAPHAEVEALRDAARQGRDPRGAACFVTLEPCCHHGKTPPCTDALIAAGISAVEIATLDPNPAVAGRGDQILRDHGIDVTVGLCEPRARRLLAGFFEHQRTGRPLVILKWAQSLDGRLAWPATMPAEPPAVAADSYADKPAPAEKPAAQTRRWITSEPARRHVHRIRAQCGAILVGAGTLLADDPELTVRLPGRHHQPLRIVLDSHLRTPSDCRLLRTRELAPVLIATAAGAPASQPDRAAALTNAGAEILELPLHPTGLCLDSLLAELGRRGILELLVEGGPTVLQAFLNARLPHRLLIYLAPLLLGQNALPLNLPHPLALTPETTLHRLGQDLLLDSWLTTTD